MSLRFWSTSVDSLSALTVEPSLAYRTLGCATLLVDRLLSFRNAFVSFQISFPSELSVALFTLHLIARLALSLLL